MTNLNSQNATEIQFTLLCEALARHEQTLEIHRLLKNLDKRGYSGVDVIQQVRNQLGSSGVQRLMAFSHTQTVNAL